jgi:hypothetical protein
MGYKLLGFVVWRVAGWYLRRRFRGTGRKLAIAGGAGLLVAGGAAVFAAQRRARQAH